LIALVNDVGTGLIKAACWLQSAQIRESAECCGQLEFWAIFASALAECLQIIAAVKPRARFHRPLLQASATNTQALNTLGDQAI
jgi:hypothetical protein